MRWTEAPLPCSSGCSEECSTRDGLREEGREEGSLEGKKKEHDANQCFFSTRYNIVCFLCVSFSVCLILFDLKRALFSSVLSSRSLVSSSEWSCPRPELWLFHSDIPASLGGPGGTGSAVHWFPPYLFTCSPVYVPGLFLVRTCGPGFR